MSYLWPAISLVFIAAFILVLAAGDFLGKRLARRRNIYERVVGHQLYRLFLSTSSRDFAIYHTLFFISSTTGCALLMSRPILGGLFGAVAGILIPRWYLKMKWNQRLRTADEQIEEALMYMANSFRANPSLPEAINDACQGLGPPLSQEFSVLIKEYRLGTPLNEALVNLQHRLPSRNLKLAISALVTGRRVGGNIPEILDQIAAAIRESYRLERVIDTQTSQGRMQAWVMGVMPLIVVATLHHLDPRLIEPLFNTLVGNVILGVAAVLNVAGIIGLLKVVSIEI